MKNQKKEFKELLAEYSFLNDSVFSTVVPESEWKKKKAAEEFLAKYWISDTEYRGGWEPIQNTIFINPEKGLPELRFSKKFEMLALRGGILFVEKDFLQLQTCMKRIGEKYFVVIENSFGDKNKPIFRMKFPVDITWQELMSGGFISIAIVGYDMNEYFVLGESGSWGKYAANDYIHPLDIIGFKKEYSELFRAVFKVSLEEQAEIAKWIPPGYLDR